MSNLLNIKDENGNWIPIPIATNGIASIIQNSDYTLTITLEDGTIYTTTSIRGEQGAQGIKGDKGDSFAYSDFTPEQLASLKGEKGDKGDQGIQGIQGERGEKGIQGIKGDTGEKGDKGDAFTYSDFTPEQLASLKGEKGDKGDAFEYSDFSPQQLASLKGEKGDKGEDGQDYVLTENDKQEIAGLVNAPVEDVQIDETSIVSNGVAGIPRASYNNLGVVKTGNDYGIASLSNGRITVYKADDTQIKSGEGIYRPIVPNNQHESAFYGLAKASGDTTQSASDNAVGTYTDEAKASIQSMLGVPSEDDVVTDVQVNGMSIVQNNVTNILIDTIPTQGSTNAVSGGGVYSVLETKADKDSTPETVTPTETDADFYLSDANGNVILELADGHIKTKEFDSSNINTETDTTLSVQGKPADAKAVGDAISAVEDNVQAIEESIPDVSGFADIKTPQETTADLFVCDSQGNVIAELKEGHVRTKNFDSAEFEQTLSQKQNVLTFDNAPTEGSENPVTSGGVYTALGGIDVNSDVYVKNSEETEPDIDVTDE